MKKQKQEVDDPRTDGRKKGSNTGKQRAHRRVLAEEADARQLLRNERSPLEQVGELDRRGAAAVRERRRLV